MATAFAITGNSEILPVVEAVSREKGIPQDIVIEAMQMAIETVARRKYGHEQIIRAEISRKNGEISLFRDREIVDNVEDTHLHISLEDAKERDENAEIGGLVTDPLPPVDFGRVTSQTFKQVLMQKIREAEREKQYDDFKDRVGEIVTGVVKRVEFGSTIIDFGKTETILPKDQMIPREAFRVGDRIRAYILDVKRKSHGPQIILTRTHPEFLGQLFSQEVPEIYDGLVTIKSVVRDAGSRAKIAVTSGDSSVDPVGACIGPRGTRVTSVYNELQGEKIDIVQWSPDLATFAVNALASKSKDATVEVGRIIIDEDMQVIEAVVPDEHLSLAIGRRGQNVRLASQLIGWNIDVISESEESTRRMEEFNNLSEHFNEALNVDDVIGQLLASEGFRTIEEVAYVPAEDMLAIDGFEAELVEELQRRASEYLEENQQKLQDRWQELGVEKAIAEELDLNNEILVILGENDIKTLDDFADLASDELLDILPKNTMRRDDADALIMKAREHWFEGEEEGEADAKSESSSEEAA